MARRFVLVEGGGEGDEKGKEKTKATTAKAMLRREYP
jgi:hypothetical protein